MLPEKVPPVRLDFDALQSWVQVQLAHIQSTMHMHGSITQTGSRPQLQVLPPTALHITTLGIPEVLHKGKVLEFPYQKVLELLLYLIFNTAATKDQLLEDIWDGKSADSVYTAIRQLRRLLKDHLDLSDEAIVKKGKYYSLSPELHFVLDTGKLDAPIFVGGKITPPYLSELMEGLDSPWIEEQRMLLNKTLLSKLQSEVQKPQLPLDRALVLHLLILTRDVYQMEALDTILKLSRELALPAVQRTAQLLKHALGEGAPVTLLVSQLRESAIQLVNEQRLSAV